MELEKVVRDIQKKKEMELIGSHIFLAYAGDIVILGTFHNETKGQEKRLLKAIHNMGLIVNEDKTKCMIISRQATQNNCIKSNRCTFVQVK